MSKPNGIAALRAEGWSRKGDNLLHFTHEGGAFVKRDAQGLWIAVSAAGKEAAGSPFVNASSARKAALHNPPKDAL